MGKFRAIAIKLLSNANFYAAVAGVAAIVASAAGVSPDNVKTDILTVGGVIITLIGLLGYNAQKTAQIKADAQVQSAQIVKGAPTTEDK